MWGAAKGIRQLPGRCADREKVRETGRRCVSEEAVIDS